MSAPSPKIDLHMHTTLSDGRLTPEELVGLLDRQGVDVAAVTDHDSTEGLDAAIAAAERYPRLRVIAGIEISADHPTDPKSDVHVLGYFLDYHDDAFQERLQAFRDDRKYRGQRIVERLGEQGYAVAWERVLEIAGEAGVGRPHIAQALVERGYIKTVKEAFNGLLNDEGTAFVGRSHISIAESVELIASVGGVAVLAHPLYVPGYEKLIPQLASFGIVGFEVHYGEWAPEQRKSLARLAERYGMLPTGGSDYHAMGHEGEHLPGTAGPPAEVFAELEKRAEAVRSAG